MSRCRQYKSEMQKKRLHIAEYLFRIGGVRQVLAPFLGNEYSFHKYTEPVLRCFLATKNGVKSTAFQGLFRKAARGENIALSSKSTFFWELTFRFGQQVALAGGMLALRWRLSRPSRRPGSVPFRA